MTAPFIVHCCKATRCCHLKQRLVGRKSRLTKACWHGGKWWSICYPPQKTNISHLGKRKIIFKIPFLGDMSVPWRVNQTHRFFLCGEGSPLKKKKRGALERFFQRLEFNQIDWFWGRMNVGSRLSITSFTFQWINLQGFSPWKMGNSKEGLEELHQVSLENFWAHEKNDLTFHGKSWSIESGILVSWLMK